MELAVLGAFALVLIICVACGVQMAIALAIGYALFFCYGLLKGFGPRALLAMSLDGVKTVKNILIVFIFIGMLTAVWRICGTVPALIYGASQFITPNAMLLAAFLINGCVSMLMGTSIGTAATVGVICMSMGNVMGVSPLLMGGAILSGTYVGDRGSPMSTSALLVSSLTNNDIYGNVKRMFKSALVPLILSCCIYALLGRSGGNSAPAEVLELFRAHFSLSPVTLIPAGLIIILSLFRLGVKWTSAISVLAGAVISVTVQHTGVPELLRCLLLGYTAPEGLEVLGGGGLISMVNVAVCVSISSSFAGIFNGTGLLKGLKSRVNAMSDKITPFGGALVTSVIVGMIACNQTLNIILTGQLCDQAIPDKNELALTLEDTATVISPLIPWAIACWVPLSTIGAPTTSVLVACYLYLIPIAGLIRAVRQKIKLSGDRRLLV